MSNNVKRIAAYIRVSTKDQAEENFSLEDQETSIKNWALNNNAVIVEIFRDEGKSGFKGVRPAFTRMLNAIQNDNLKIDYVVSYSFSRLARNELNRQKAEEIFSKKNVKFISLLEQTPDDEDAAFLMQHMHGGFAEMQSRTQSRMSANKLNQCALAGFFTGGVPLYGYKSVGIGSVGELRSRKVLAINEEEAQIVRLIYQLAKSGASGIRYGVKRIAADLNEKQIKRKGKVWTANDVHRVLTDSSYHGERQFGKNRNRADLHPDVVKQQIPAIISKDIFDDVQSLLRHNAPEKNNHQALSVVTLLTGLLKCGECEANMVINTGKGGRYKYYKCRNRIKCSTSCCSMRQIPKDELERIVLNVLREKIFTAESMNEILGDIKNIVSTKLAEMDVRLFNLNSSRAKTAQKYERLLTLLASGELEPTDFVKKNMSKYEAEIAHLDRNCAELKATLKIPFRRFGEKQTIMFAHAAQEALLDPNTTACKSLLNAVVNKIVLKKNQIELEGSKFKMMGVVSDFRSGHSEFRVPAHITIWRRERDSNS